MNKSVTAIVLRTEDYKDYDKKLRLFTSDGEVFYVVAKGVKRSGAKLRFAAQPFSFCNFELGGNFPVVTGAAPIEDLSIMGDYEKLAAGCVMLEAAGAACEYQPNRELFVLLLKRLKTLIYEDFHPLVPAISYIQNVIHKSGYAYEYAAPLSDPSTVMELLACTEKLQTSFSASEELIKRAFGKIVASFESKFLCKLKSATMIIM